MHTKNGIILAGLTVTAIGLLGIFGYVPGLAASVLPNPLVGATVSLAPSSQCFIYQCTSFGSSSPTTFTGTSDPTGSVSFTMNSYTTGSGTNNPLSGGCTVIYGPGFTVTITPPTGGVAQTFQLAPFVLSIICPGVLPQVYMYPESQTYTMSNGQQVLVNLNAPSTTTTTSTTSSSTTTSTSTTTTSSTTTCISNCPPAKPFPLLASVISLAGMGITVVGIRKKEDA